MVPLLRSHSVPARKVGGEDLRVIVGDVDRSVDAGFRQFHHRLSQHDVLILKADQEEPLVLVRMSQVAEIAEGGDVGRKFLIKGSSEGRAVA